MTKGGPGARLHWRKSSYSGTSGNCVEVTMVAGGYAVRDLKDPATVLTLTSAGWSAFCAGVRSGEFD